VFISAVSLENNLTKCVSYQGPEWCSPLHYLQRYSYYVLSIPPGSELYLSLLYSVAVPDRSDQDPTFQFVPVRFRFRNLILLYEVKNNLVMSYWYITGVGAGVEFLFFVTSEIVFARSSNMCLEAVAIPPRCNCTAPRRCTCTS
jgi:hypothetical protein